MDDNQLCAHMRPADVQLHRAKLEGCILSIQEWCAARRLQLNPDKTELIWFGSRANLSKLNMDDLSLRLGSVVIKPSDTVRDLGVILDSELTMRPHIAKIASVCFFHLRRLRQIQRFTGQTTMQRLVSAFVLSRMDYCNVVLAGLPSSTLAPLQRVLHAAVRLVAGLGRRDHITETMKELHWLPVNYRVKFKACLLMHSAANGQCPSYIVELVTPISTVPGCSGLRSSAAGLYIVPRTRTKFGDRAFSVAGPREWNALPAAVRDIAERSAFRRALTTHLFKLAYDV